MWMRFAFYEFESFAHVPSTQFLLFLYIIFASNCTRDTEALRSVRPCLCLAGEWTHFALWCKHATSTYSSLAALGVWLFLRLCLSVLFIFFINIFPRQCQPGVCSPFDVSAKDWTIGNDHCLFGFGWFVSSLHITVKELRRSPGISVNATPPKICQNVRRTAHIFDSILHSKLNGITVLCVCIRYG